MKNNTLFYCLGVIVLFIVVVAVKNKNKKDSTNKKEDTDNTITDPVSNETIHLPEDYDPTEDAPIPVNPGGITATVPDNKKTDNTTSDTHSGTGGHFAVSSYTS